MVDVGFTIVNTLSPDVGRVEWRLDPEADNDIASTEGYWELVPIDAGERTLIRYLALAEVGYARASVPAGSAHATRPARVLSARLGGAGAPISPGRRVTEIAQL